MNISTAKVIAGYSYDGARSNLSNINAYSAALKHLNKAYPHTPWLYGATAIPFLFRVGEDVNTAPVLDELPHDRIVELLNNLGVRIEGRSGISEGDGLNQLRKESWDALRQAVDAGYPCFGRGFEFSYGETSVVQGYDEASSEYIISCWRTTTTTSWQSLGESDGLVDLHWILPDGEAEDDRRTVREALQLAIDFSEGRYTASHTRVGFAAYEHWVAELRRGTVDSWFFAYHTHEWDTCRTYGLKFLEEVKERLGSRASSELSAAIDAAIVSFAVVREKFHQVYELFPWEQPRGLIEDTERRLEAAKLLDAVKYDDEAATAAFRQLVALL